MANMDNSFEMDRRGFLKGAGAAGVLGAAAAAGVYNASEAFADEAAEEEATEAEAAEDEIEEVTTDAPTDVDETVKNVMSEYTDGKYVTKVIGHEGWIYVETTMKDGAIADCQVLSHEETVGIGSLAAEQFPAKIVESQSLNVDVISGATITCKAIVSAVAEGINNSGANADDFRVDVETVMDGTAQTADVDVVVMGAGTSGLIAATRLLEKGMSVLVFEKQDIPGGSMCMTYSGIYAAGSELQSNYSLGRYDDSAYFDIDAMLEVLSALVVEEYDPYDGAMPYDRALYETSADLVDWMHDIGIGFYTMGVNSAYGLTPYLAPGCYEGGCGYAMEFLVDRIDALGGQIVYATSVTELVTDDSGAVIGVKAEGEDGSTWDVTAKATLLASGGFAANDEMVAEYYPDYAGYTFNCSPGSTGDGIVLAQGVGAAIECMGRTLGAFLSTTSQAGSRMEVSFLHSTAPGIMVNAYGDQFANIMSSNHFKLSAALINEENGGAFYYITDESGAVTTKNNLTYAFDTYKTLFDRGDMVHYDSVEEAAEAYGLTDLAATIETHNAHALADEEDEFGRSSLPYLDTHDGLWVCPVEPTLYLTTGGLAIDTSCHVLDEDGNAISGLYAAGDVCGSVEEKDGKMYGMGFDAAMNYGYIAAETLEADLA